MPRNSISCKWRAMLASPQVCTPESNIGRLVGSVAELEPFILLLPGRRGLSLAVPVCGGCRGYSAEPPSLDLK